MLWPSFNSKVGLENHFFICSSEIVFHFTLQSQRHNEELLATSTITSWHSWHTFSSVQLFNHVWLFATPWTTVCQASLSITNPQSLPKLMSIESVMPSSHLILCRPLLLLPSIFPTSGSFQISQLFASGGQNTGVSTSTWHTLGPRKTAGYSSHSILPAVSFYLSLLLFKILPIHFYSPRKASGSKNIHLF